jgi:LPS export ABC transporter protein LptC
MNARHVTSCPPARAFVAVLGLLLLPIAAAADPQPLLWLSGMTFVGADRGTNDVVLEAERASFDPGASIAMLETVQMHADDQKGSQALDMTCQRARLDLRTNSFRAEGDVRGRTGDGRRFTTSWVEYDDRTGRLSTDAPVVIEDASGTYRGGGFRFDVRTQRLRLVRGAQVLQP